MLETRSFMHVSIMKLNVSTNSFSHSRLKQLGSYRKRLVRSYSRAKLSPGRSGIPGGIVTRSRATAESHSRSWHQGYCSSEIIAAAGIEGTAPEEELHKKTSRRGSRSHLPATVAPRFHWVYL